MRRSIHPSGLYWDKSFTFKLASAADTRLRLWLAWVCGLVHLALQESYVVGWLRKAYLAAGALVSESVSARWFKGVARALSVPPGEKFGAETVLGLSLLAACLAPTEVVLVSGLIALFASAYWRLCREAEVAGASSPQCEMICLPPSVLLAMVAMSVFIALSALVSVVPRASFLNLIIWGFYILFFLLGNDAAARGRAEKVLWPFLTGASLAALVGILQRFTRHHRWLVFLDRWLDPKFHGQLVRVVGTFSNPTFFAEMLGLALPVTIAMLLGKRNLVSRCILLSHAVLQAVALILTYSRGAWLGFLVSFAALAVFFDRRLLIAGLVVATLILAVSPKILIDRFLSSFSLEDSSNSYRLLIWRGALALLRANLFRGVGLGAEAFAYVYPEYMIIQTPAPHAHSTYLEMLIELGLPGFAAMVWFFIAWVTTVRKPLFSGRGNGISRWAHVGVLAGVVAAIAGHMLQGLVEHTWYSPRVTSVFWAFAGLACGLSGERKR